MEQNQQQQTTYAHTIPNSDSSISESFPCNDMNKPGRSKMDMVLTSMVLKKDSISLTKASILKDFSCKLSRNSANWT